MKPALLLAFPSAEASEEFAQTLTWDHKFPLSSYIYYCDFKGNLLAQKGLCLSIRSYHWCLEDLNEFPVKREEDSQKISQKIGSVLNLEDPFRLWNEPIQEDLFGKPKYSAPLKLTRGNQSLGLLKFARVVCHTNTAQLPLSPLKACLQSFCLEPFDQQAEGKTIYHLALSAAALSAEESELARLDVLILQRKFKLTKAAQWSLGREVLGALRPNLLQKIDQLRQQSCSISFKQEEEDNSFVPGDLSSLTA